MSTRCRCRYYVGSYEKEIMGNNSVKEYDYIYTPEGLGAIVTKTGGSYSISYVHTDHLGSPRVISNGAKAVLARYSYDAWGKRTLVAGANITNRGFTGHEHIDEFGLINMNARLYDPTSGRFISIDPYVQAPDFSQSFNRYSYALNNPLSFTDPNGEFPIAFIIGAIVGAYLGGSMANKTLDPTRWDFRSEQTWAGMVFGGLAGGLGGALLFGPGGVMAGGTTLNVSLGVNIGNLATGVGQFAVSNSGVIFSGLGFATAAGGLAWWTSDQLQGKKPDGPNMDMTFVNLQRQMLLAMNAQRNRNKNNASLPPNGIYDSEVISSSFVPVNFNISGLEYKKDMLGDSRYFREMDMTIGNVHYGNVLTVFEPTEIPKKNFVSYIEYGDRLTPVNGHFGGYTGYPVYFRNSNSGNYPVATMYIKDEKKILSLIKWLEGR